MKELEKNNCWDALLYADQSIFRPNCIFNNDAYSFKFSRPKILLIFFLIQILSHINKPCILGFLIMKNKIKKAPVKFWEELLYFHHLMQIFFFIYSLFIHFFIIIIFFSHNQISTYIFDK